MTLDYSKHKNILLQILKDIYSNPSISPFLGFKGGTAAAIFYGLNRNSVDLDFDLLDKNKEQEVFEKIQKIAEDYGKIISSKIKRFNLTTVISYEAKAQHIKIEVSRRNCKSQFEPKTYLGIPMLVMAQEDMFANKLMAMFERIGRTSRDIYDVYFFAKNDWSLNKKIVEARAELPLKTVLTKCISRLEKMENRHVLDGLGEMLSAPQKDWARAKMKSETIFLLKLMLESEK